MGPHPYHRRAVPHHHPLAPQYGVSRGSVQLRGPVSVLQANEVYAQEQAKADQERRERESRCEAFWQEHTSEWAKGYIVAELREE